jgi:hypothetical protein
MCAGPGQQGNDDPGAPRVGFNERPNEDGGHHRTLFDRENDNHISWDTDADGDYRNGSGHEDTDGRNSGNWDR